MIDEKKLIEKLFNLRWDFIRDDLQLQWNRAIDKVVHVIQEQPTIQPQTGWIPCSSGRLPKDEDEEVYPMNLVTLENGDVCLGVYRYDEGTWRTRMSEGETLYTTDHTVTAWQPLPQPYKESE